MNFGRGLAGFGLEPQPQEEPYEDEGDWAEEETDLTDGMNEEELVSFLPSILTFVNPPQFCHFLHIFCCASNN